MASSDNTLDKPCINSTRGLSHGYPLIRRNGKTIKESIYVYIQHYGHIEDGMVIKHKCDNKLCIEITHLEEGTYSSNTREAVERGLIKTGERSGLAYLLNNDILVIKDRYAKGESQTSLALEYGVSQSHLSKVINGRARRRG